MLNAILTAGLGLATSAFVARWLGPTLQGEYSYLTWLIGTLGAVVGIGLPTTALRYVAESLGRGDRPTTMAIVRWILRVELMVALLASAALVLWVATSGAGDQSLYFMLAAGTLVPTTVSAILSAAIQGAQEYGVTTRINLTMTAVRLIATIVVLLLGLKVVGLLLVSLVLTSASVIWLQHKLKVMLDAPEMRVLDRHLRRRMIRYAASVFLIVLSDMIVWQRSEVFFLERFSGAAQVGFYSLAFSMAQWIVRLPEAASWVLMPAMSELYGAADTIGLQRLYDSGIRYMLAVAAPACLCAAVAASRIVDLIYGAQYQPAATTLTVLLLASCLVTISNPAASLLHGTEKQTVLLKVAPFLAILDMGLAIGLIPHSHQLGAALANSLTQGVGTIILSAYIVIGLKLRFPLVAVIRIYLSGAGAALLVWLVLSAIPGLTGLAVAVPTGIAGYMLFVAVAHVFKERDRATFSTLGSRLPAALHRPYQTAISLIMH